MSNTTSALEEQVRSGRPVVSFTVGDSMEPLLHNRSTRVVICKTDRPLHPGELPLYRRPDGQFIMHRIIRTDGSHYYTRGDNRCGLETVPRDWVLGVVTEIYRGKRHFSVNHPIYRVYVTVWNAFLSIQATGKVDFFIRELYNKKESVCGNVVSHACEERKNRICPLRLEWCVPAFSGKNVTFGMRADKPTKCC